MADCLITGERIDKDEGPTGDGAGTSSGQQFFTRNSEVDYNTYGTTLNNFFMGVIAANNLTDVTGTKLKNNNGYTNWGIPGTPGKDDKGKNPHQVITEITSTPKISEKPFLYIDDDGEYKVFVPAVKTNARGVSWGEGKANDGMGEGKSLPLSDFYIAKPSDSAATINQQIAAGKNIYFTPGAYHAETPILVNRKDAILLGSGMASIIPDNEEMAMKVGDLDGIRIEGLIFDAGLSSEYLLKVGDERTNTSHSSNPIILQDLFFRVGGTTDVLTKADDALEINCNDVIGDHFWIWRADHGAGVEWYGNESKHGLIVNGDNVKCYALFNEHFQEYHTLWNGENGEMYFYQNETCYDPISQDAWMSHGGTVNGYSSYKVSNDVEKHYAVGLGVYNVFIYTGPSYDSSGVGIQLDNAIEVPNKPDVLVENACIQTFANDDSNLVRINHIINGVGGSASSGYSEETRETGEGWSRKFLLYYNDGEAEYGKETNPTTFGKDNDQRGYFIGTETKYSIEQPDDEYLYLNELRYNISVISKLIKDWYTANSWKNADVDNVLEEAKSILKEAEDVIASYDIGSDSKRSLRKASLNTMLTQGKISKLQTTVNKACTKLEAAKERLICIGNVSNLKEECENKISASDYDTNSGSWRAYQKALETVNRVLEESKNADTTVKKEIYKYQLALEEAYTQLGEARKKLTGEKYTPVEALSFFGPTGEDVNKEEIARLQNAYDNYLAEYKTYKEPDYTAESWAAFAKALADAEEHLNNISSLSKLELEAALEVLEKARLGLTKNDGTKVPVSTPGPGNTPEPGKTPEPANTPEPDKTPGPVNTPEPGNTPGPANTPEPGSQGNQGSQSNSSGNSNYDPWLWAAVNSSTANNGKTDADMDAILAAIKEITDSKSDLADTEAKADALLAIIDSLVKNMDTTGEVKGVTLNKSSVTLNKGKKIVLKASVTPVEASNKTVIWNSSNTSVATVTKNGTVKAVGKGTAKITATTADGLKVAACKVTVKVPSTKITLNKKNIYIVKGSTLSVKGIMKPADSTDKIKWSSSKPSIATIKNGRIKAKKNGTITVTAKTTSGKKATCKVHVVKKETKNASIQLSSKKISMKKGGYVFLNEVLDISDVADAIKWKSSKKKVASVDVYGYIKAKKKGTTNITVTTNSGRKAKYKVTVQ